MKLEIKKGSENYTAQVLRLPAKVQVKGFDRLVKVTFQGNDCLISKDSPEDQLYLFFPSGSVLAPEYLSANNLYRHSELNRDKTQSGLIDDSGRVKSVKLKGVISTGLIMPMSQSLLPLLAVRDIYQFRVGDSFNTVDGHDLCIKYQQPQKAGNLGSGQKKTKILDEIVEQNQFPPHYDTSHLLRNLDKLSLDTEIVVTVKTHGTSCHTARTLIKKNLTWKEKLAKKLGIPVITHEYAYLTGSRRVLKSVNFKTLDNKNHYYEGGDLWTKVAKEYFEGKLNAGEVIYGEIYGRTYDGKEIQKNYDYGFDQPKVQIYRITNINPEGIEVDLSWNQMVERAAQLGVDTVIPIFKGTLSQFIHENLPLTGTYPIASEENKESLLTDIFYNRLLEKKSIIGGNQVEEGFCIRIDSYPKSQNFKIKARSFILGESKLQDDASVTDIEENN